MTCYSMTGFGSVVYQGAQSTVKAEIRAVNHRFLEVTVKMSRDLFGLEEELRALVGGVVSRGRVDLYVTVESGQSSRQLCVDWDVLDEFCELERQADKRYGTGEHLVRANWRNWIHFPEVVRIEAAVTELALIRPDIVAAVQKALGQLMEGRAREGARLCQDMMSKLLLLRQLITECTERAPIVAQQYRDKLRAKLSDLLERVDESRLITEMAVMLERQSIDEELVRIQSHVLEFEEAIHGGSPVGRRLDFIVQEMNREMNTIGSKTTDIQVTKAVVEAKVLIEQLREQAQNIE